MAGTDKSVSFHGLDGSVERTLIQEHNKLVDDLENLRAVVVAITTKLDADAGVTDTNYTSVSAAPINPATDLLAAKIKDGQTGQSI